jgi:glycosyltransferase involved in cell wall biosynthesis
MNETRRVLYVEHMADVGGGQMCLLDLVRNVDREKYAPVVTCVSKGEFYGLVKSSGVDTEIVDIRRVLRKSPLRTLADMRALGRIIRERRIDIVHVYSLKSHLMVLIPALLEGVPVIWHCEVTSDYGKFFDMVGCLGARVIVAASEFVSGRFGWFPACRRKVRVVYNAVDLGKYDRSRVGSNTRAELGIDRDAFVVGGVGRLAREKGFHCLIEAAAEISGRVPRLALLIVGGGPPGPDEYVEELRRRAADSPVAGNIIFTGYRRDVPELMAAMDVVAVPSLREVFGLVAVEAMALARPVVASAVGGLPEVVEDGVTGILIPPRDPSALAEAVTRLYTDAPLREKMGVAGRRRAGERFDLKVHVKKIENIYAGLVGDPAAQSRAEG